MIVQTHRIYTPYIYAILCKYTVLANPASQATLANTPKEPDTHHPRRAQTNEAWPALPRSGQAVHFVPLTAQGEHKQ